MTGWGRDGSDASKAGHDLNYIALSGALEPIAAPGGGAPVPPMNLLGDFGGGGMLLALGVVSALLHARGTGQGQVVDASIVEGTALLTAMHQSLVHNGRWSAPRGENLFDGGAPFYAVYACADGPWLSVGAIEPQFYADLVDGLGLAEDLGARQWDAPDWPRQRRLIAATIAGRGRDTWLKVFAARDACVAPVLSSDEAALHPQFGGTRCLPTGGRAAAPDAGTTLLRHAWIASGIRGAGRREQLGAAGRSRPGRRADRRAYRAGRRRPGLAAWYSTVCRAMSRALVP
jgi:alpha-methylacyl-CoA racemase